MSRLEAALPATHASHVRIARDAASRWRAKPAPPRCWDLRESDGDALEAEAIDVLGYDTALPDARRSPARGAVQSAPAAMLVELPDDPENAVSLFQLFRRIIAVLTPLRHRGAGTPCFETRARIHPLRPYYFAPPVPSDEPP